VSDELQANITAPLAAVANSSAAGSRIAGYRLEQQVGAGGMAVVYRAIDERLGRRVALKILAPSLSADEAFRQRFIRESRAAAAVDDPHIIPVYEAGEADGVLFIAMRYVPGGDVRTLVREHGPMAPARAVEIISSVASALDAAHAAGLVHRDVKPGNMLIDTRAGRPDHVYLSDFGLSKAAMSSTNLTGTGLFLGTADYSAPEQIDGRAVDGRADQYSLACAAFELLCGVPPFQREQATATIWAHMSEPPPPMRARRPDIPPAVDQVFAAALAKGPASRYNCCRDFAYALRWALGLMPYRYGAGAGPGNHPAAQPPDRAARGVPYGAAAAPAGLAPAAPAPGPPQPVAPGPVAPGPVAPGPGAPAAAVPASGAHGPAVPAPGAHGPAGPAPGATTAAQVPATFAYPHAATYPHFGHSPAGGAWKQDWTAWALIAAGPVALAGLLIGPASQYGQLVFFGALIAVPIALIAKVARRRQRAPGR
jgi:serine/threonine-protein kinase